LGVIDEPTHGIFAHVRDEEKNLVLRMQAKTKRGEARQDKAPLAVFGSKYLLAENSAILALVR
jgi:hypothetical protein